MKGHPIHQSHPEIIRGLRRAEGHLRGIIDMIETQRPCLDVAQQLQAVERRLLRKPRRH